ncbi:MAG: glycosyltransferase family 39 protein [Patescibacteria group bacterium]
MKKKTLILLFLIVLLGAFLRLYKLDKFPPSLFGDEVDVGYQAYSILKTGRDYSGNFLPLSFQSLADWRTPLFLYGTVPFVWFFGLTELGVRFQPALFGILTIPIFYLLVRKLFENEILGLLAALFLAISPWHLQYSRAAFEVTQMLFFLILGLYLFLIALKKPWVLPFSALFLALTPYSYNTAKLFLPVFILVLVFIFFRELRKLSPKWIIITVLTLVLVLGPMVYDIFFGQGGSRFGYLSIFNDPTTAPEIGFERLEDLKVKLEEVPVGITPTLSSRIFHNKFLSWGTTFLTNYFRSFSTEFLFTFGDINLRHSIQGGFGQLFWLDSLFLLLGFLLLTKIQDMKLKVFLFSWLLLSPIPSALTQDGGNHATRLILMLPVFLIFISFGFYGFLGWFKRKTKKIAISFLLFTFYFLLFGLYLHRYYIHYPLGSEEWWHYGFKELAAYVKQNENKYDYVVWSDRDQPPLIFSLFWLKIDPWIVQENKLSWTQISDAIWADHLPGTKYYFGHISEERIKAGGFIGTLKPNILYLAPEGEIGKDFRYQPIPNSIKLLDTIYYPSGRIAKYILTGL